MSHLIKAPKRHALFLPEVLVEIPYQGPILSQEELKLQKKAFEKAEKSKMAKDDKASISALRVAEESINIIEQQEEYRRYEAEKKIKSRSNAEGDRVHKKSILAQSREINENLASYQSGHNSSVTPGRESHPFNIDRLVAKQEVECVFCGEVLSGQIIFCPECGTKQHQQQHTSQHSTSLYNSSVTPSPGRKSHPFNIDRLVAKQEVECVGCGKVLSGQVIFCPECGTEQQQQQHTSQHSTSLYNSSVTSGRESHPFNIDRLVAKQEVECAVCGKVLSGQVIFCPECGTEQQQQQHTSQHSTSLYNSSVTPGRESHPFNIDRLVAKQEVECVCCGKVLSGQVIFCPECGTEQQQQQHTSQHSTSLYNSSVTPGRESHPFNTDRQVAKQEVECVGCGKVLSGQVIFCPECGTRNCSSNLGTRPAIQISNNSHLYDKKRRSSQLLDEAQVQIKELSITLQDKEHAIQTKDTEMENVKRRLSELLGEAQAEIRELKATLQDKEHTILAKEDEIQRNSIQMADEQIQLASIKTESWNIPRAEMQKISKREIGHGAWGVVYSGTFQGERVAIKIAHRNLLHTTTIDMLKREVMIMANIQHPNLVRFVGAVFDDAVERGRDMPIIVSELMDMNLRDAYTKVNLSPSLVSIFCDVAYALHYLHQHSHPIIHRDVSAPNVLLKSLRSGGYQAKVSDFGSANLVKQATTAGAGAIVYCAPEMFPNEDISVPPQLQTTKVDVFSYGILMLEVIVKEMPTPSTRYAMLQQVKGKWTLMYELIVQCTKPLPCDRPAMADILNKLNRIPH